MANGDLEPEWLRAFARLSFSVRYFVGAAIGVFREAISVAHNLMESLRKPLIAR
jgi:hypothetical protein